MKRKIKSIIIIALSVFLLTGCCISHDWQDATCTEPKTCIKCGKTEGRELGHTVSKRANYQEDCVCEVCGELFKYKLESDFEKYDIKGIFMETGQSYDYVTSCNPELYFGKAGKHKTIGQATIADYQTFSSDETHEEKEGYEWKTVEMRVLFSDENANKYGIMVGGPTHEDYYDIDGHDLSLKKQEDGSVTFHVNWDGTEYTECCCKIISGGWGEWAGENPDAFVTFSAEMEFLLPEGYDGIVLSLYDKTKDWKDGMHIYDIADENTLFFRLQ